MIGSAHFRSEGGWMLCGMLRRRASPLDAAQSLPREGAAPQPMGSSSEQPTILFWPRSTDHKRHGSKCSWERVGLLLVERDKSWNNLISISICIRTLRTACWVLFHFLLLSCAALIWVRTLSRSGLQVLVGGWALSKMTGAFLTQRAKCLFFF